MTKKITSLLCIGLLSLGCTRYEVEGPELPQKLSAYALLQDSLPAEVWLGYANNRPSSDFAKLSGPAEVRLFRDGNFWQELKETKDGFYLSMDSVEAGHHYEIQVQTEEGVVSAGTYFSKAPKVNLVMHDSSATGYSGDTLLKYKTVIEIEQRDSVSNLLYVQRGSASGSGTNGLFVLDLPLGQKHQLTYYSSYRQSYSFNFYSESYYNLLKSQETGVNEFNAFYRPPSVSGSDFEGALGYFGWMHSALVEVK